MQWPLSALRFHHPLIFQSPFSVQLCPKLDLRQLKGAAELQEDFYSKMYKNTLTAVI